MNNEKIETNNWTRLLIFDDKINFYFLNMFLYMASVVYCRTFLHFMSSILNNKKKLILETHPPQKRSFERRICRFTDLKKVNMIQMNPKEVFHNTANSVQLPYISRSLPLRNLNWTEVKTCVPRPKGVTRSMLFVCLVI